MLSENNAMYMPVAPAYGNNANDMFGGNNGWWILILLVLFGWGNGNNGWGGNGGTGSEVQRGFDQNAVMNGLAGINNAVSNGFQNAETAAAARQMAEMNQNFAVQSALQNCCCENRAATADLKYTVATENCADRTQGLMNTRDIIDSGNRNTQAIMDKLCQLELDGVKQNYEGQLRAMQNQLTAAQGENQALRFAASQGAQTAQILANNEAQTSALERYLAPTPIPAYMVQNPNCCQQWGGCGCGCGAA